MGCTAERKGRTPKQDHTPLLGETFGVKWTTLHTSSFKTASIHGCGGKQTKSTLNLKETYVFVSIRIKAKISLEVLGIEPRDIVASQLLLHYLFYLKGCGTVLKEAPPAARGETFPIVVAKRKSTAHCGTVPVLSITGPPKMNKLWRTSGPAQ